MSDLRQARVMAAGDTVHQVAVLSTRQGLRALHERLPQPAASGFYAFYSTVLGGITTDPALFNVPLDEHGFHRGHAG
jgi:hypothetical protein